MAQYVWDIGSENIRDLFETTTMYFDSKNQVLNSIDIDPSTYRDYLNEKKDTLSLENAYLMLKAVGEPEFRFEDSSEYIQVPEEDAWGTGRIELENYFQEFLFSRELFGPFEEPELKEICGISRQSYHNYREDGRSIPVEVYESLFEFYSQIYSREFDFEGDVYPSGISEPDPIVEDLNARDVGEFIHRNFDPEQRFDLGLNGSRQRLEKMEGFEQSRDQLVSEINSGMNMTRPKNPRMEEVFEQLEGEDLIEKIGRKGRLYRINV